MCSPLAAKALEQFSLSRPALLGVQLRPLSLDMRTPPPAKPPPANMVEPITFIGPASMVGRKVCNWSRQRGDYLSQQLNVRLIDTDVQDYCVFVKIPGTSVPGDLSRRLP